MRPITYIALLMLLSCAPAFSQQNTSTKSSGREFKYRGKPVSPEKLLPFFPSPPDSMSQTVVNLNTGLLYRVERDSMWVRTMNWVSKVQAKTAYTCATDFGFVSYIVIGNPARNEFVLLACMNNGGTFTRLYTFVVQLKDDKLIKVSGMKTNNVKEYPVSVKGNSIFYDKTSYPIPSLME